MTLRFASHSVNLTGFTDLDRAISVIGYLDFDPLTPVVDHDSLVLDYDSTRKGVLCVRRRLVRLE